MVACHPHTAWKRDNTQLLLLLFCFTTLAVALAGCSPRKHDTAAETTLRPGAEYDFDAVLRRTSNAYAAREASGATNSKESEPWRGRAEEGAALLKQADAVLRVSGEVQFESPKSSNRVTTPAEFEAALKEVPH